jgi:hypothetical protein
MAEVTRAMRAAYGYLPNLVPDDVRKSITEEEMYDRLVYAGTLMEKAEQARDRTAKAGFSANARAVLNAPPREETAKLIKSMELQIERCDATGGWFQGQQTRRRLTELRAQRPIAPERTAVLTKAQKDSGLMPVYDEDGTLIGLVDPAKVTPVADLAAVMRKDGAPEDEDEAVDEALDGYQRYLGTPKTPAGEYPAAVPGPGALAKAQGGKRLVGIAGPRRAR